MNTKQNYNPLFFLASLGAGGMSVTFFMYLMFMTQHSSPIPTFDSLSSYFTNGTVIGLNPETYFKALIIFAILGIVFFAFKHIQVLIWNLKELSKFQETKAYTDLKSSNAEVTLMAMPLTLAMTINVMFILGAVFIPGLWEIVEYLFPMALLAFLAVGILALRIFGEYFSRLIVKGDLDFTKNNSLAQMIAVFAFAMIGVGFAAPAAMSHTEATAVIGLIGSTFFITAAIFLAIIKIVLGFKSIFKHGLSKEAAPSLWILIPIITLIGISLVRQGHGLDHLFALQSSAGNYFVLTTILISLQLFFGFIGYKVMKANDYFKDFVNGKEKSAGSYALICPGVALFVFGFFFIHLGFVKTNLVEQFSIMYFAMLIPLFYLKFKTIQTMFKLNKKMF